MKNINWSLFVISGVIAILFGILALFVPQETIIRLTLYFGILILAGGLILLYLAIKNKKAEKPYVLLLIQSILVLLVGGIIAFQPGDTLRVFLILIGAWATLTGLLQIILAVRMKGVISRHGMFTLNGIITLVFGLLLLFKPVGTAAFIMVISGILALVAGVLLIYLGVVLRGAGRRA
ncbi:MAG: DUF308 domain-containing protein [Bacteroidales bacterium]